MAHPYDAIPKNLKSDLKQIVYRLEPENLSCDGECSRAEMETARHRLFHEWAILVRQIRTACCVEVDFDEFEEYMY